MEKKGMPKLIGLGGVAHSGKDTVASFINFLANNLNASYDDYLKNADSVNNYRIVSFADPLKRVLSNIYDIHISHFNNTYDKDNLYYLFDKAEVVYVASKEYHEYVINNNLELSQFIAYHEGKVCIKLRTLMQYFGTNVMRKHMGNTVWIDNTIRIVNRCNKPCIISDVRFTNESKAIKKAGGVVVKILRNPEINNNHESEIIKFHATYTILNNEGLEELFYTTKDLCSLLINNSSTGEFNDVMV